jgi:SAM-dependent methyltransferase
MDGRSISWLSILRCPYCSESFTFCDTRRPRLGAAEFGILRCSCSEFPVIDGVPIVQKGHVGMFEHTTGETQVPGPLPAALVDLLKAGQPLRALLECLVVPALPLEPWLPWRVAHSHPALRLARYLGKRRLRDKILAHREGTSVQKLLDVFFRPSSPLGSELAHYFLLRFGQPRHLAALALLPLLPSSDKPVLDIACGLGHFEHYLTRRRNAVDAVGTDMNFYQLWIARHWIAPSAHFVCSNAEDGLPFVNEAFSATVCSDAYHYISNRRALQREIGRCAMDMPVLLTRVGNASILPREGHESTLEGYLDEFAAPDVHVFSERRLIHMYLDGVNPFTEKTEDTSTLRESKWLSFGWNVPVSSTAAYWPREWPHAVGRLGLNPVYRRTAIDRNRIHLRFDFRTPWYAYENNEMLSYLPMTTTVDQDMLRNLDASSNDPRVASLVTSFVLIGLPQRFQGTESVSQ